MWKTSVQNKSRCLVGRLVIAILSISLQVFAAESTASPATLLEQINNSLKKLADRVAPAVPEIKVVSYGAADEDDQDGGTAGSIVKQHLTGAGVIVDADGYILTNAHLINGAIRVQVVLNRKRNPDAPVRSLLDSSGRVFDATIVGADEESDLAVLKIDASALPTLKFGNYENLRQGQLVIAFGSPLGLNNVATIGIVSSVARQIDPDSAAVYIQTDAAVNPGNSGGALVDIDGNLVGINTAMLNGQRLGLAIPSDTVQFVYEQIRNSGRVLQGDIGIGVQTITANMAAGLHLAKETGVLVSDVRPGLPADAAGIHPEDIVASVDQQVVGSALQFITLIKHKKPGEGVSLRLLRGKNIFNVSVAVVQKREDLDPIKQPGDVERHLLRALDVVALDIDSHVAETLPGIRQRSGVLVTGKCASRVGMDSALRVGDVIHAINGTSVSSLADIRSLIARLPTGSPVVMRVERDKGFLYVVSEVE